NRALDPLTGDVPSAHRRDAHILPRNPYPPPNSESEHLLLLNLLLVGGSSPGELGGKGLGRLHEALQELDSTLRKRVLESQFLPQGWDDDDPVRFLDARLRAVEEFLRARLGYGLTRPEPADPAGVLPGA